MTSTHTYYVVVVRTYHMKTSFFSALFALVDTFKDHIRFFRFIDCDHLHFEWVASSDQSRERFFADLALKFSEVVGNYHTSDFLLDLTVNPHLETLYMNSLARSFALAGWNHKIIRTVVITEAEFAWACNLLISVMNSIELSQKELFLLVVCFFSSTYFDNSILDSSQFDNISRTYLISTLLRL